ncbi:hypothetical protein G5B47_16150 [Paenibacillus sp. 7124]|uniref:Uncharacterized protein n=1 Tax=Paenibacillus apii TaxID=1850370 RepID=A0A6M1PUL2_9BACL|nr:hypothetical protein [Paenibacillus apii]NGM83951.1 hypothetical protein [Paenibacillus apii]
MTFDPIMYKTNRSEVHQALNEYLNALKMDSENPRLGLLVKARLKVLGLCHYELLILQSSIEHWKILMSDPSLTFRRELCAKLYKLKNTDIMNELELSSGAVSNLLKKSTLPIWPRPFKLTVLFGHPWQLINYESPDPNSLPESPEYFEEGVSQHVHLKELAKKRSEVSSIRGYVIADALELFKQESTAVTGRWVTTYPEFDYFDFHLNHEPLIDNVLRGALKELFPLAKHVITTYRPFKPESKRALWVIVPKDETLPSYAGMLHELKEYRERTEYHRLK